LKIKQVGFYLKQNIFKLVLKKLIAIHKVRAIILFANAIMDDLDNFAKCLN